jgi:hypothetical protein
VDDLEEPESGEELELDLTSPDLALKTDQEPEEDGKEHVSVQSVTSTLCV